MTEIIYQIVYNTTTYTTVKRQHKINKKLPMWKQGGAIAHVQVYKQNQ